MMIYWLLAIVVALIALVSSFAESPANPDRAHAWFYTTIIAILPIYILLCPAWAVIGAICTIYALCIVLFSFAVVTFAESRPAPQNAWGSGRRPRR